MLYWELPCQREALLAVTLRTNVQTIIPENNRGVLQVDGSITSDTFVRPGGSLAGTGNIDGNVRSFRGATVAPGELPGTPGTFTISGNCNQSVGKLLIEIASASLSDYNVLNVLGTAHLGGTLDPMLLNGFIPTVGEQFVFLDYSSVLGGFGRIEDQTFNNGTEHWAVIYEPAQAILVVRSGAAPIPDQGSTLLLLTLGFLALVTYRRQLLRRER